MMSKGNVFVVSGPSGSGKDTLLRELFKKCPEILFSISSTTRAMREEDKIEKKYDFISKEQFEYMIASDKLLEYNLYKEDLLWQNLNRLQQELIRCY